jgi:hypothetical protein
VQGIAAEGPRPPLDQAQTGFIAQKTAGGQRVSRIQAWRVQCGPARKRCEACSDEPAAHGGRCCYVCGGVQVICRQSEGCGVFDVDVYTARLCLCACTWDACVGECSSPPLRAQRGRGA